MHIIIVIMSKLLQGKNDQSLLLNDQSKSEVLGHYDHALLKHYFDLWEGVGVWMVCVCGWWEWGGCVCVDGEVHTEICSVHRQKWVRLVTVLPYSR